MRTRRKTDRLRRSSMWALVSLLAVATIGGCHRSYYRQKADSDAYSLITEKAYHPHWALEDCSIEVDPRSRMFDPFDPDRPPMPPDDPDSHQYMHMVDGKRGFPRWHANGDTTELENPYWREYLPLNEDGVLVLDAHTAVQLALLHSREYQNALEQLYLSALDVSFERFRFDSQFFGGYTVDYNADGRLRSGAGDSRSALSLTTSGPATANISKNKLYTTGADLVVGLANSIIWQFSGPDTYAATTLLDFTLVQPLLRNGGRDRVMERLTLSERTLLANVRQMERFRRGFHLEVVTGANAAQAPRRRGGLFGGAGLEGFSGVGAGGFGGLGGGGGAVGGGAGTGTVGGFMGLLQTQQQIHNQRFTLYALRSSHFRLRMTLHELLSRRDIDSAAVVGQRLQVAQARQSVLQTESDLDNDETQYERRLDDFKTTLGLPPDICVEIRDPMLERLNLIHRDIVGLQEKMSDLQQNVGDYIETSLDVLLKADDADPAWRDTLTRDLQELGAKLDQVEEVRIRLTDDGDSQIRRMHADGVKLSAILEQTMHQHIDGDEAGVQPQDVQSDIDLLSRIRNEIDSESWWQNLQNFNRFNLLRDQIHDIEAFRLLLDSGGRVNIEWMQTDTNPTTRAGYEKYRDVVQAMENMPDAEAKTTHDQIVGWLEQDVQPLNDHYMKMTQDYPWLEQLDRWRAIPYEVESAGEADTMNRIRLLERLFAQFLDMVLDTSARMDASGSFDSLPGNVRALRQKIDELLADVPNQTSAELADRFRREVARPLPQELVDLADNVLELSLVQARTRAETVSLVPIDLHPAAAVEIARVNRRDWMNARAALVDTWRLVEFNADNLESTLDIVFSGDMSARDDNPLKFDAATGRLRAALQFDAPLTRLSERNTYRQSLIEYQQARRNYYAVEDQVSQGFRNTIRTILLNQRNFQLRREAVWAAAQQIELNQESRRISDVQSQASGPTTTRDTVSALRDLLNAQNQFLGIWVTYEVLRRALDFDLGTMQMDSEGMWIDPGPIGPETGYPGIGGGGACWPGEMVMPENGSSVMNWCTDAEDFEPPPLADGEPLPEPEIEPIVDPRP